MITPALMDDAFLADVAVARSVPGLHVWWLGQSGYLLQHQGVHLLIDPYLSDSLTIKYAATDKPHVPLMKRVVDPARLNFIDLVTSSHNHTDHLDGVTLKAVISASPKVRILTPAANQTFAAERLGVASDRIDVLDAGQSIEIAGIEIVAVAAAHEKFDQDEEGRYPYLGYVFRIGPWTVYHSGDTVVYPGMDDLLRMFDIDLAMLPINGSLPERRVSGNMWGRQAAALVRAADIKLVIPCHYDMFAFNTVTTDEFETACREFGRKFELLEAGRRLTLG